jgi:V8-like Glu-specific endopeptidase
MAGKLDKSVTNGKAVDTGEEVAAETGPVASDSTDTESAGGAIEPGNDAIEDVPGFQLPTLAGGGEGSQLESAGLAELADPSLDEYRFDIGNASFGFGPETVHGMDDRVQITFPRTGNYPWRVHCSLLIKAADNSNWIGTGWFISPNVLITAGHVVYIKGSGVQGRDGWVNQIRAIPGRDGSTKPYGEAVSTKFYSVRGWTEQGNAEYDYGAIVLDAPLGNRTGWFGFGVYDDSDLEGVTANISGYPGDKPSGTQWYGARRVDSVGPRKVFYDIDTAGGQSGSAVYRIKGGSRYGIAVHAYGGAVVNSGTRINRPVYDNMKAWKKKHKL